MLHAFASQNWLITHQGASKAPSYITLIQRHWQDIVSQDSHPRACKALQQSGQSWLIAECAVPQATLVDVIICYTRTHMRQHN